MVRVPLTHHDLARLRRATANGIETLTEWLPADAIDMEGEPETFVDLDIGRRFLVLRHEAGACLLLNDAGRCGEYALRPAACAAYPFAMSGSSDQSEPRTLFVLSDSPCGESPLDAGANAEQAVHCVEVELIDYVTLVQRWNRMQRRRRFAGRRPKGVAQFLDFLRATPVGQFPNSNSA